MFAFIQNNESIRNSKS